MKPKKSTFTATLICALALLSLLITGIIPSDPAPEPKRIQAKELSKPVAPVAPAAPAAPAAPLPPVEPRLATKPPRVGDAQLRLAKRSEDPDPAMPPEEQLADFLRQPRDLTDPAAHAVFVAELQRLEDLRVEATRAKAEELGLPLLTERGALLVGFDADVPLYEISHNAEVAKSIGVDLVRQSAPYFPDGESHKIGLWDVYYGATRDHDEMSRIHLKDDAVEGGIHASHVAGTLTAVGLNPQVKGMTPAAEVWSFSSTNVLMELSVNAAQNSRDLGKLFVSVHPYGVASGWEYDGAEWYGNFSNDGDNSNDVPIYLGQYGSSTSSWDGTLAAYPFHLAVKSSGNHNDDNAPAPGATWYLNGQVGFDYDPATHPKSDGAIYTPAGYGTVDSRASAKNVLTVGSVSDAVTGGVRDPGAAVLSDYSSTGPTDDGRIKPDLVANGDGVLSVDGSTTNGYLTASGTSMSSASVAGGAQLLQEIYLDFKEKHMRASTLKGLLIHTADDLGIPGPDYRTGWGLANVQAAAELLYDHNALDPLDRFKQKAVKVDDQMDYFMVPVDGSPLRITLSWTDEAGQWTNSHDSRTRRLVNDLNLRLVAPDGTTVHYPYMMPFTATWAESDLETPATTGVNGVDNVEQIYLEAPIPGLYRIEVDYAGSLQGAQQDYSLLVSGTYLEVEGVEVKNPVSNKSYMVTSTDPITVANANSVFSGTGHQYDISWTQEGILTATVDPSGNVLVTPTLTAYGRVDLTLDATDSTGGTAQTSFSVTLQSNIVRVDRNTIAPPAEQNGTSWALAYGKLQDALDGAISGQEIWVVDGVYYPDERNSGDTNDVYESFTIPNGVDLYGAFSGTETTRTERNPNSQATILSGDLWQDDQQQPIVSLLMSNSGDWNNCYTVVSIPDAATLDSFVVTAGNNTDFFDNNGGGIWVRSGADARIGNCLISGNGADGNGGGVANEGGKLEMVRCKVVGNQAGGGGGALSLGGNNTTLSHCEFRGNQASDGGAVYFNGGWAWITDCLFSGNSGFFGGGGIHVATGWFEMVNCTMTGHTTFGQGGAIQIASSSGNPLIYNTIIWKNYAAGSEFSPGASAYGPNPGKRPYYENCLVANSGGSANWNSQVGWNGFNNIDTDPGFISEINPTSSPSDAGDFRLAVGSPVLNLGNTNMLYTDDHDLDGDGLVGEQTPVDLAGNLRVFSTAVDLGAYEFGDPNLVDGDNDGLSDAFEATYGVGGQLDPLSDDDADGLTAVAEFVHGLNPNQPLDEPVGSYAAMEYLGSQYLCMTYRVDPNALNFVNVTIERRGNLASPLGWQEGQTLLFSTMQSTTHPGMLDVTVRSLVPFGQDGMEFLRIRHDIIPTGSQTLPQSDPQGSTSVSGWNVWGP